MKKVLKRIIAFACMLAITVAFLPSIGLRAADNKPGTPSITVKAVNGTDVKVTIGKTSGADGYEVWVTSDCGYTGYKTLNLFVEYDYNENPGDYINAATVEKDGTAVRTVTLKNFSKASVSIKVRAYAGTHYTGGNHKSSAVYGEFSKAKTVKVTAQKKGHKSSYNFSKVKTGDTIKFGTYEQDYPVDGKDPIEWVVLDKTKSGIVVMSKYALDCLPYNTERTDVTWETCTLRKWLNEKFYNAAFNKTEKSMIRKATVHNNDNPYYGTEGGNDTKDKVFLLSIEDAFDYFDINLRCAPSRYAVAQGAIDNEDFITDDNKSACWWWLRSPGDGSDYAAFVYSDGYVYDDGADVFSSYVGAVRPVLVLKLKS
ncbi:MAG: DUF6273 domain-containing protein [Lachnospiraceae bacterium]|nr:DUF6273 domain-containing protein [Lachnospiraceae bacterium]